MSAELHRMVQRTGRGWLSQGASDILPEDPRPENPEPRPLPPNDPADIPKYRPAGRDPLTLAAADKLAAKIRFELMPFCERIEIAGSIRRRRPLVNDIDLVAMPLPDQVNALRARVLRYTTPISDGKEVILSRLANGVQLDLWLAERPKKDLFSETATNFGALFLSRTGSKEHNIFLCQVATKMGRHFNPHHGVFEGGKCLACATEEEIFKALGLDFIPPEQRER